MGGAGESLGIDQIRNLRLCYHYNKIGITNPDCLTESAENSEYLPQIKLQININSIIARIEPPSDALADPHFRLNYYYYYAKSNE